MTVPEFLAVGNPFTAFLSGSVKGGDQVSDNITEQNVTATIPWRGDVHFCNELCCLVYFAMRKSRLKY